MRKTQYVVYLCGASNAANKSMNNNPVPVAVRFGTGATAAERREHAVSQRIEGFVTTVYNGQYLRAVPVSRCPARDVAAARDRERNRELYS